MFKPSLQTNKGRPIRSTSTRSTLGTTTSSAGLTLLSSYEEEKKEITLTSLKQQHQDLLPKNVVNGDKGIHRNYTHRMSLNTTVPVFLDDCVKAEHLRDAMPLSELPAGGSLRKDSFDTNGIVVSRLGEKMRDYVGYQSHLEQLLSENKTDDEIFRKLAHKAVKDLCCHGIKNEDGTWEGMKVEADASFSETQTKHNDDLPVTIRHSVFGPDSEHGVNDLIKSGTQTGSSLSHRGEKKVGAFHEQNKKNDETRKSRGVKRPEIYFDNNKIGLGSHSIEESERKLKDGKLLAKVTRELVKKEETAKPNVQQFTRMLEVADIRVKRNTNGSIIDSRKLGPNPDGPANIEFILREYNKAKAERDQSTSVKKKDVNVSVTVNNQTIKEEKQLVASVPVTSVESESSLVPDLSQESSSMVLGRPVVSCSSDSESSLLPSDLPPLPPVSKISSDDFDSPLRSLTKDVKVSVVLNGKKKSDKRLIATQVDLSRWIQPSNEYNYYGSICDDAPPLIQSLHYYHNRSYYKNNTYDYLLSSRAAKRQRVETESSGPVGWNCPECTLLNDLSDVSCKVCWYTLPRKRKSRSLSV